MKPFLSTLLFLGLFIMEMALPAQAAEYDPWVLNQVLQNVASLKRKGETPVLLFDIDDTLISTRTRSYRILKDFIIEPGISSHFPFEVALVKRFGVNDYRYELSDTFKEAGIRNSQFIEKAKSFWSAAFFSNSYCAEDGIISGANRYVREARERGATIVYLTGRSRIKMGDCTKESLANHRFPLGRYGKLLMHPGDETSVLAFKNQAFASVRGWGTVVAAFENEPENINAMAEAFPKAAMVFVDTIHSSKPVEPLPSISWVPNFQEF